MVGLIVHYSDKVIPLCSRFFACIQSFGLQGICFVSAKASASKGRSSRKKLERQMSIF